MASSITVTHTGSILSPVQYQYTWTVTAATDMPQEVFLLSYKTGVFERVCLASDMSYPTTKTPGVAFYRVSVASGIYGSVAVADARAAVISSDLQALVDAYNSGAASFITTKTEVFS